MIYIALDLSINSTGALIANTTDKTCKFIRFSDKSYAKVHTANRYETAAINSQHIANAITKSLLPYRYQIFAEGLTVGIETVGFGLMHRHTSSVTDLLFEGAIVSSTLHRIFNAKLRFVAPKAHKRAFTGSGNASKQQSIDMLLHWFPQMSFASNKMDDLADAMSIMTTMLSDIRTYEPSVITL